MAGRALTDIELAVVTLLAAGHTNKEIARRLSKSVATVRSQIEKVAEKMDLRVHVDPGGQRTPGVLRAQIVQRAYRLGLIE